jgi:hypothetical protein
MAPTADPTITDLRRELEKARHALAGAEQHLARHAEMNAALHCADRVMYSPLHAKVAASIAGIDHALQRSQPTMTATAPQHSDANCPWIALLADLDRCEHSRHQGDVCGSCDGASRGNPHMQPGDVIGYSLRHGEIVMPDRENKHDISAWRHTPSEGGA